MIMMVARLAAQPGSGYVLLHHVMGDAWAYVEGGMGAVSNAIAGAAAENGVVLAVNAPVSQIHVGDDGAVSGVTIGDGAADCPPSIDANMVLSSTTIRRLVSALKRSPTWNEQSEMSTKFNALDESVDYTSMTAKINVALSKLPRLRSDKSGAEKHDMRSG